MNRNEMIKWLSENTTQEQWSAATAKFTVTSLDWFVSKVAGSVTIIYIGSGQPLQPILFDDVFEQPVFIDGAEYIINPLKNLGYPFNDVRFTYDRNTNRFNSPDKVWLNAGGFGKDFTVELVAMGPAPCAPDYVITGKGNIYALSSHLKLNGASVDIVAGEALSRLKAQAVIVARVLKLNKVCQKHNIGHIGDSVIDSVIDYIEKQDSHDHTLNEMREDVGLDLIEFEDACTTANLRAQPRNKYDREILQGVHVDVYDVLGAFKTDSAAIDHAIKKLLVPGQRGAKDRITDLNEAVNSIQREIDRINEWGDK